MSPEPVFVDGVALWAPRLPGWEALDVAAAAVAASGHDARQLPSVFASAHADLAVVDALCDTLADDPLLLSPTRFHHSVHNAASGYWAIASGCTAPSSAVGAGRPTITPPSIR